MNVAAAIRHLLCASLVLSGCKAAPSKLASNSESNLAVKNLCTVANSWWVPLVVNHMPPVQTVLYGALASGLVSELEASPVCAAKETDQFTAEQIGAILDRTIDYAFLSTHKVSMQSSAVSLRNFTSADGGDDAQNITQRKAKVVEDLTDFDRDGLNSAAAWASAKAFVLLWDENLVNWADDQQKSYDDLHHFISLALSDVYAAGGGVTRTVTAADQDALSIDAKIAALRAEADDIAHKFYEDAYSDGGYYCRKPKAFTAADSAFVSTFTKSTLPVTYKVRKIAISGGPICVRIGRTGDQLALSDVNRKAELKINEFSKAIQQDLIDGDTAPFTLLRSRMGSFADALKGLDAQRKTALGVDLSAGT